MRPSVSLVFAAFECRHVGVGQPEPLPIRAPICKAPMPVRFDAAGSSVQRLPYRVENFIAKRFATHLSLGAPDGRK
jgi:hypothetical protein